MDSDPQTLSREFLRDCLERISKGDAGATYDLAAFWMSHITDRDPEIELGVAEGLLVQAAKLGSKDAEDYLSKTWPDMKEILKKRLTRSRG
jgi:hypothetical protein